MQKLWALYTAGEISKRIKDRYKNRRPLRIDWIDKQYIKKGQMGITILPGRKDWKRSIETDIISMKKQGISHVLTLITFNEFHRYGVGNLLTEFDKAGFKVKHIPILDQSVTSHSDMCDIVRWMDGVLNDGGNIMIHCVGGLGRSGVVAASYLVSIGMKPIDAIKTIRKARSERALETQKQENFVYEFAEKRECGQEDDN
jgi:protein-tyrosine phosphatase